MNIKGSHTLKSKITFFAVVLVVTFAVAPAYAQEPLQLVVGQTTTFTECNHHETFFLNDAASTLAPWPVSRDAQSEDGYAAVALAAKPGEAGQAFAGLGVQCELVLGAYTLQEALSWPVIVTFELTYELSAFWQANSGSASAGIGFPGLRDGSFDIIGFPTGESGSRGTAVKAVFSAGADNKPLTVSALLASANDTATAAASVMVFCQAATLAGSNAVNNATAAVMVHSITIEFLPRSLVTTTTTTTAAPDRIVAGFAARPVGGEAPLTVRFLDMSSGDITAWNWQFGDGRGSSEQHPQHTYLSPGTYDVSLTVTGPLDKASLTKPALIAVSQPQVSAAFDAAPRFGPPPLTVQFTDQSKGPVNFWRWDFGDGTSSLARNPSHTYSLPGTYTVALTAGDNSTSDKKAIVDCIRVIEDAPVADFAAEPLQGIAPLTVQFSDQSVGTISEWLWEFGDGQNAAEQHPAHTYALPGTYTVGLIVRNGGRSDFALRESYVTVEPEGAGTFSLAGQVSGAAPAEVTIFLSGDERRMATTDAEGTYGFAGLRPGNYAVTPFAQGARFEPPSAQMAIDSQDVGSVDFSYYARSPAFVSVLVEPAQAPADGSTPVLFVAQTAGASGEATISDIVLDLRPIGGPLQPMADDGTSGDDAAGDGIYTYQTVVAVGTSPGPKGIRLGAFAGAEARSFAAVELGVISTLTQTLSMNSSQRGTIKNEIQGQTLVWQVALTGEEAAARVQASSEPAQVTLQLFDPENSAYLEAPTPLSAQASEIQIAEARQGSWTYEISNQGLSDTMYSLSVATTGTGVISGNVVDVATGAGLDGASIATNGGGASLTEDGYFILVHPAGMFTVQANLAGYVPAAQSVSLSAGQSQNLDMALSLQGADHGSDNRTCLLEAFVTNPSDLKALDVVRLFRDSVLMTTLPGRRAIELYYAYSAELTALARRDPVVRAELKQCLTAMLPLLSGANRGEPCRPGKKLRKQLRACLARIRAEAGNDLQAEVDRLLEELEHDRLPYRKAPCSPDFMFWVKRLRSQ